MIRDPSTSRDKYLKELRKCITIFSVLTSFDKSFDKSKKQASRPQAGVVISVSLDFAKLSAVYCQGLGSSHVDID